MSTIRKRPFIEEVVKSLSDADLATLKELVNTNSVNLPYSVENMPAENGVYPANFYIENGKIYSSILIKNNNYTVLIAYHRFQDLLLFNIVNNQLEKVNEYLDINELRRIIDDMMVESGEIGSGDANAGEVLIADGAGGTDWGKPTQLNSGESSEGDILISDGDGGTQWVAPREIESDEHVVTFDAVEFVNNEVTLTLSSGDARWTYMQDTTVDCVLVLRQTNGTQIEMRRVHYDTTYVEFGSTLNQEVDGNGIYMSTIYSARFAETGGKAVKVEFEANKELTENDYPYLHNLTIGGETYYVVNPTELENYAKVDGYYETFGYAREAGIAKNLQNDEGKLLDPDVDTSSGTTYADAPFVQRATAMSMKAYLDNELITVGSGFEQWRKEQAFSIVRNQVLNVNQIGKQDLSNYSVSGKVITFTAQSNYGMIYATNLTVGHKYLVAINVLEGADNQFQFYSNENYLRLNSIGLKSMIFTPNNKQWNIRDFTTSDWTQKSVEVVLIDLTKWFASRPAIATALTGDAGVKWFLQNYPKALTLDYDEGTIIDTEDYDYETTGVNLFNKDTVINNAYISGGGIETSNTRFSHSDYIEVFPSTEYRVLKYEVYTAISTAVQYDANKNFIGICRRSNDNTIIYTNSNAAFIIINMFKTDVDENQFCQHFTETSVEQTYHKYEIFKDRISWAFTSTGKGKSAGNGVADTKDYVNKKNIEKVGQRAYQTGDENDSTLLTDGTITNYPLSSPIETDMTGDELDTNIPENDYGVERKVSVSGDMFSGSATTIFYQDNVLRQIYNNKDAISNLNEELNELQAKIPNAPTTDGTYTLKVVVLNGVATYSWILDE